MNVDLTMKTQRHKWTSGLFAMIVAIFAAVAFVSFVFAPVTGDIQVFIAAANQVQFKDANGLKAVFEAWELKGIANRTTMYVLYKIASTFVKYGMVVKFELVVKLVYAIIALFFIVSSSLQITRDKKKALFFGFIEYMAVFATYTASQLQAEMTCVILSVFVFACLVHQKKWSWIISGIFGAFLFFFKSVFILLYFIVIVGAAIYKDRKDSKGLKFSVVSFLISEITFIGLVGLFYPQEFKDMSFAAEMQSTLFSDGSNVSLNYILINLTTNYFKSTVAIPFIFIGLIGVVLLSYKYIKTREWVKLAGLTFIWTMTIDIIVVSNNYFIYHYFLLVLPGFMTLLILVDNWQPKWEVYGICFLLATCISLICTLLVKDTHQIPIINYSTVLLVCIHIVVLVCFGLLIQDNSKLRQVTAVLLVTVCSFYWVNYSSVIAPKYQNERDLLKQSQSLCREAFPSDFSNEPVLFLDAGVVPFYINAASYSRYFYNLPLNRWEIGNDWEVQRKEYEKVMAYKGKYIVYSNWIGIDKYPDLKNKINSEYNVIPNSRLMSFSPDWNVFSLSSIMDERIINGSINPAYTHILVRKEL